METLGERIRKRREELKMEQAALARLLDIAPTQVNRYEAGGRTPSSPRLRAIARILKVKPSWLRAED